MPERAGGRRPVVFAAVMAAAVLFVVASASRLPPVVASHFDSAGHANGYMPRTAYVVFMLVLVLLVPLALVLPLHRATAGSGDRLNLPNRDWWLHPDRIDATRTYLRRQARCFSGAVAVFLAGAHGMVVHANLQSPVALSPVALPAGLGVFLAFVAAWMVALVRHFNRRA